MSPCFVPSDADQRVSFPRQLLSGKLCPDGGALLHTVCTLSSAHPTLSLLLLSAPNCQCHRSVQAGHS